MILKRISSTSDERRRLADVARGYELTATYYVVRRDATRHAQGEPGSRVRVVSRDRERRGVPVHVDLHVYVLHVRRSNLCYQLVA